MTAFDEMIAAGWSEHGDQPERVAERLASSLALVEAPERVEPFARLASHVLGEHLGAWQRGRELLAALRALPACDAAGAAAIARHAAALGCASGDERALAALAREDVACALALAAAACAGRRDFARAVALYGRALGHAQPALPPGAPALRALAVAGNNLAAALQEQPARSAAEDAGMLAAARGALAYWKLAGTWLEEERAELMLARSLTLAGDARAAADAALRCLDVCERNGAPAFERFYGAYALAAAVRAAGDAAAFARARDEALALLAQVPSDEQRWCEAERADLGDQR